MPTRPGKACRQTNCPIIAKTSQYQGYCEEHKNKAGWHLNERTKGNRHIRGYGSEWDKLKPIAMKRDSYLCQFCINKGIATAAAQVDHIRPKAQGLTNSLSNLQSLCEPCHRAKTAREYIGRGGANLYSLIIQYRRPSLSYTPSVQNLSLYKE
jgi:5-methylcytosine-specific restriction protein A